MDGSEGERKCQMIRRLKILGLTLVAALAIVSIAAGTASADIFTAETSTVNLSGSQEGTDVFKVHGGQVNCTSVTFSEPVWPMPTSHITLTPTYSGCTFAGLAATVNMNGCVYEIWVNAGSSTEATASIGRCAGREITVTAPSKGTPKCILHIPGQLGLTSLSVTNIGAGATREITVSSNINNISYSQTKGTAETGNCATADKTTGGTYEGKATLTASLSGHIGIFLS
jgi:hypothetical protein